MTSLQRLSSLKIISLNFTKVSMSCLEEKLNNKNTLQFWCFKTSFQMMSEKQKSQVSFLNQVLEEQYLIETE